MLIEQVTCRSLKRNLLKERRRYFFNRLVEFVTFPPRGELITNILAFLSYISHLYLIPHRGNDISGKYTLSPTGDVYIRNIPYPSGGMISW